MCPYLHAAKKGFVGISPLWWGFKSLPFIFGIETKHFVARLSISASNPVNRNAFVNGLPNIIFLAQAGFGVDFNSRYNRV